MGKDYYKVLGVDKNASQDEIKKAFRKKAHEYHPDKKGGDEAKFKEINEAYQVLDNQQKRSQYDKFGSSFEQAQGAGGFHGFDGFRDFSGFSEGFNAEDFGDIFGGLGDIFGFSGGGGRGNRKKRGADIQAILNIDFLEAVFGAEKEISLNKTVQCDHCHGEGGEPGSKVETCKTCNGSGSVVKIQRTIFGQMQVQAVCSDCFGEGKKHDKKCRECHGHGIVKKVVNFKVKIPAGINNGGVVRLTGQGEMGARGASAGDLYLEIRVKPDRNFRREGDNILSKTEINFTQAALGDKINIKTVDGEVSLKIPEGTQSNTVFKLKNRGVPNVHGRGRGDHLVEIVVVTPKNLNKKQKEILKDLGI